MTLILNKIQLNFILVLFIIFLFYNHGVKSDEWEYNLVKNLLKGYDPSIRPSIHHNLTLNVTFGLSLAQIIDVDERNMIITSNCWLNQQWIDPKLVWDPEMYDGIQFIHVPADKIWRPDILLMNNADAWAKMSSISTNAIVKHNGNVTWLSTVIYKSSCSIHVKYFPFDEQVCDMIFASWTFDGYFLDIHVNTNEGDLTNFIKNGEWHLVELSAVKYLKNYSCCDEPYPEIYYKLRIRRRPLYYVFNMVFPCLLITLVAFLGFFLPPDSSEKVSIGITTLLSLTVFLTLVAESLPPTSEQLPLLGIYYFITIGIVSFSTFMAVVTLNINNKGNKGKRLPKMVKVFFFEYVAKLLGTELRNYMEANKLDKTNAQLFERVNEHNGNKANLNENNIHKKKQIIHLTSNHIQRENLDDQLKLTESFLAANKIEQTILPQRTFNQMGSFTKSLSNLTNSTVINQNDSFLLKNNSTRKETLTNNYNYEQSYFKTISSFDANNNILSGKSNSNSTKSNKLISDREKRNSITRVSLSSNTCKLVCECNRNSPIRFIDSAQKVVKFKEKNQEVSKNTPGKSDKIGNNENFSISKSSPILIKGINSDLKTPPCCSCELNNSYDSSNCQTNPTIKVSKKKKKSSLSDTFHNKFLFELDKTLEKQFKPLVFSVTSTIEKNEQRVSDKAHIDKIKGEWQDLALVCDHFLCYFFPIMTLVICLLIFINSPHVFSQW